ncbi:MAG: RNA polymerase sigma-70 factor [Bacteroidales bacterium]|nr:RNA polymerase sigma-70 factor [Bacteroidales bacterium]
MEIQPSSFPSAIKPYFEALFNKHFKELGFFAMRYVKDSDSAREIVHDVFINLWEKRESIDPQKDIRSYLFTSVKNRCLNHIRDNRKFNHNLIDIEEHLSESYENADSGIEIKELKLRISQSINQLPQKCREVFEMSRKQNLKYAEIAIALNISIKTVEAHMTKALQLLRKSLSDYRVTGLLVIYSVLQRFL